MDKLTWNQFQTACKKLKEPIKEPRTTVQNKVAEYLGRNELHGNGKFYLTPTALRKAAYELYKSEVTA